jgi:hypothetical protein
MESRLLRRLMLGLAALLLAVGIKAGASAAEAGSQAQMVPMLPDRALGDQSAPVNMIEYASTSSASMKRRKST